MIRWLLLASVIACGGSNPGVDDDAAVPDGGVDSSGPPRKQGIVFIQESFVGATQLTTHVVEFRDGRLGQASRTDGPCKVTTGLDTPTGEKVGAGTISIAGLMSTTMIFPIGGNDYQGFTDLSHLYADGERLDISAPGDAVLGFSVSINFPTSITVTNPAPGTTGITIDRSAGFTATWSGTSPVRILLTQPGTGVQVQCTYSGVTTGTVPASALVDLVPGASNNNQMSIVIAADAPRTIAGDAITQIGDFDLQFLVIAAGFAGSGVAE
jgi:hypothetical protein